VFDRGCSRCALTANEAGPPGIGRAGAAALFVFNSPGFKAEFASPATSRRLDSPAVAEFMDGQRPRTWPHHRTTAAATAGVGDHRRPENRKGTIPPILDRRTESAISGPSALAGKMSALLNGHGEYQDHRHPIYTGLLLAFGIFAFHSWRKTRNL